MTGVQTCALPISAATEAKSEAGTDAATEAKSEAADTEQAADTAAAGEEQTLKVAAVETAYGQYMWKEVCAAFQKANPGVTVELTIDKKLEDIITPAMKSGDYPDVIMRPVGGESALTETFIKDNNIVDLTDVL